MTFEIGSSIKIIKKQDLRGEVGLIGKIIGVDLRLSHYKVDFGEGFDGHDCEGMLDTYTGYNIDFDKCILIIEIDSQVKLLYPELWKKGYR